MRTPQQGKRIWKIWTWRLRTAVSLDYGRGPGLITLARKVLDDLNAPTLAEPILEELAQGGETTAALGLITDRSVFVAAKREGGGPVVVTIRLGHRFPLTYGCHGKAIAAFLPDDELGVLLKDRKLYFQGDPAKLDLEKSQADIERCRKDWFAEDVGETTPGLNAVASPILGPGNRPLGYIVVIGLASAEATHRFGPVVADAARELSRRLGATVDDVRM